MTYKRRLLEILKNKFGHSDYKNVQQKEATEVIYKGKNDVCIYMPSGFGKSLCYQLPILAKDRCFAIVISPSIAQAKNQVDYLKSIGVTAYMWNAYSSKVWIKNNIIPSMYSQKDKMKILFLTAEVFTTSHFQFLLTNLNPNVLAYFVVDEAHCVSSHSHDYKESYEQLKIMRKRYPSVPIVAVTATANDKVKSDIIEILCMNSKVIFSMPVIRSNLYYDAHCIDNIENPIDHLKQFIEKSLGSTSKENKNCGLIFCQNYDVTEKLTNKLSSLGLSVLTYSKRYKIQKRHEVQNLWTSGEIKVLVTTSCFGKGISKLPVRFVVHWGTPLSIGHYYQETGRAGHDGLKSICRIYYNLNEINSTFNFIQNEPDLNSLSKKTYKKIIEESFSEMKDSFKKLQCRHVAIYKYFDETVSTCKNLCDVCKNQFYIERSTIPINRSKRKEHLLKSKRKKKNSLIDEKVKECIVLSDDEERDNIILSDCEVINIYSSQSMKAQKKIEKQGKIHKMNSKTKIMLNKNKEHRMLSKGNDYESKIASATTSGNYALSAESQLERIKQILYIKVKLETNRKKECIVLSDSDESNSIILLD